MKKDKNIPAPIEQKSDSGTNPKNKFKKGSKGASIASLSNIITSAVGTVEAKSGSGLANEGTDLDYSEERWLVR